MQLNLFDFQEENKKQDSNKRIVSNLDLDDVLKNLNPNLYRKDVYFERFEFDITWPTKGRWLLTVGEIAIRNTKLPYRSDYVWMNFDLADGINSDTIEWITRYDLDTSKFVESNIQVLESVIKRLKINLKLM